MTKTFPGSSRSTAGRRSGRAWTTSPKSSGKCRQLAFSVCALKLLYRSYIDNGSKVAIVCSARSTQTKSLGTTNLLLQASREALQPAMSSSGDGQSGSVSGTATPFYPKRVGSGFFGKDQPTSMTSSVSSLSQLDSQLGRSGSPSPFQSSCSRSPPRSPITPSQDPSTSQEPAFHTTVDLIKKGHLQAARASLKEGPLRDELEEEIERDCESLRSFLYAAQVCLPIHCHVAYP